MFHNNKGLNLSTKLLPYSVLIVALSWVILPLYWLVNTAFKPIVESTAYPPTFVPKTFTLDNFTYVLFEKGGLDALLDSLIVAGGTLSICLVLGVPAAYTLSRYKLANGTLPFTILSFKFMPPVVFSLAAFIFAIKLDLLDTHLILILMNSLINLPFIIWLMKGFIDDVPRELEEAAYLDGCSRFKTMLVIVLPNSINGIITCSIFAFIFAWNELLFSLMLTDRDVKTFSKFIPGLTFGHADPHWTGIAAMSLIVMLPIVLVSFYLNKYLVRGVTLGAVK